jgi:hypothetical protein
VYHFNITVLTKLLTNKKLKIIIQRTKKKNRHRKQSPLSRTKYPNSPKEKGPGEKQKNKTEKGNPPPASMNHHHLYEVSK